MISFLVSHRERYFLQKPCVLGGLVQNFRLPNDSHTIIQFEKRWTTVEWVVWVLPTHTTNNFCVAGIAIDLCPYVIQACHKQGGGGATCPPPLFGRSVIPYLNHEDTLCPPHYYVPFRIFRPCDGPVCWIVSAEWWSFHLEDSKLISSFQNYVNLETRSFAISTALLGST